MRRDTATGIFVGGLFLLLLSLAAFVPGNGITGRVVEVPCRGGECLALCDADEECSTGVCCYTHWDTGVCGLPAACERIREYSMYQSLEVYSDTVREQPEVRASWARFFLPLLITLLVVAYFILRRR